MNKRSGLWGFIAAVGVGSTLLFLVGFGFGVADIISPGSVPFAEKPQVKTPEVTPDESMKEIRIVSLGDSLTRGTGDATGDGYVRRTVTQLLKVQEKPVKLINNLAVNGLRADQLVNKLKEDSIGYSLRQANVILLTIGGNDLFQSARTEQMGNEPLNEASLQAKAKAGVTSLESVLIRIRKWNPDALIIYVGLYNPFSDVKEMRVIGGSVVQSWNNAAASIINKDPNMLLIPTQDLFERNMGIYISSDHFHPNAEGYAAIAERIVQSMK
ncbi:GDSL-type esterase/lipase family protein [Paenibacillus sp. ACRRX]|uniref:GDSL-type esterase/lipase family protein n=1 Tax=unclassified Paenibacillus TaxID=185978 RepID=UPI001EF56759|nr:MULTISPECIES: GDSL-type esterase/lipase family protein [unclassified Paenibacillus]MCG7406686.1 GDSL-type esterase/lipase family protein [Paenibacillus sp. ACRRX]MDK8179704.1 GDSL-type esterase/lipase family protein [Paenibacillus sp. UMB4589-SE434]